MLDPSIDRLVYGWFATEIMDLGLNPNRVKTKILKLVFTALSPIFSIK